MKTLSINLGLLGHVDSGKTSLAKCLSVTASTACFDKNPQSQERGITIDLGFSSFTEDAPPNIKTLGYDLVLYSLVDCPGHASLIRTIIGGSQIVDLILLLVDVTKGFQTQTAECLVLAEIMQKPIIVVINKIDLIPNQKRQSTIKKITKKVQNTLVNTTFKNAPIVPVSTKIEENSSGNKPFGIESLINFLKENTFVPERFPTKPLMLSVDHCFLIKGKGTIMTGTILQGTLRIQDEIEILELKLKKKVKSMQMFKKDIVEATPGDRIGVCVTQFNPKLLERGLVCAPGYISLLYGAIIKLNSVKYFKTKIHTGQKFHLSVGYETVMSKITLFSCSKTSSGSDTFNIDNEYLYEEEYDVGESNSKITYVLLEFEKSVVAPLNSLIVCSKFDADIHTNTCRIAFYGRTEFDITDSNYQEVLLTKFLIFKRKQKVGYVQRVCNDKDIIVHSLFKKQTKIPPEFINMKVKLSTGEDGIIQSSFGQGGKVKIVIPEGVPSPNKNKSHNEPLKIILNFKRYIYDKNKRPFQDYD